MCELSLPAIHQNYYKFNDFYCHKFNKTSRKYNSSNFKEIYDNEKFDGFVCGSDTIFCIDEFGFDDGYYANYPGMKETGSVAYAASFGDSHFTPDLYEKLNIRLLNFKAIGIREYAMLPYLTSQVTVPVQKVVDPTLLLSKEDYDAIAAPRQEKEKYLLLYARRYNPKMSAYAEKLAKENGWKIIEISLRATNAAKHRMFYEAGVEEFLSLVKNAEFVITNSFHGIIFSVQYNRPFYAFSRDQCDTKITELMEMFGIQQRILVTGDEYFSEAVLNYDEINIRIESARKDSLAFLRAELEEYL